MDTFELSLRSVTEDDAAAPAAAAFLSFIVGPYWWLGLLLVHRLDEDCSAILVYP